jgi:carboxymethylenebutenolidase
VHGPARDPPRLPRREDGGGVRPPGSGGQQAKKEKEAAKEKEAKLKAEIEVYAGTMHGWCPPDAAVYNKDQAEKAWSRLLATFKSGLA